MVTKLEGNKLIAKFMSDLPDYKIRKFKGIYIYDNPHCAEEVEVCFLSYNSSWDWLMPVITKCIKDGIWNSEETNYLHDSLLSQDINGCWNSCINFIKTKIC